MGAVVGIFLVWLFVFLPYSIATSKEWVDMIVLIFFFKPEGDTGPTSIFSMLFRLAFFILNTELVIRWNNIAGVHSLTGTGQVIPVVIATGSLVRVIWKLIIRILKLAEELSTPCGILQFSSDFLK